jgi:NAD(P)-dependent dehydrogenase (short-subunit alcohol dehydrogenase family)
MTGSSGNRRLQGKVAIVTGGGTGIGKASALRFSQEGARVVVAGRRETLLHEAVREIEESGGEALAVTADVGIVDDTKRIVSEAVSRFGALHVLFNNAATVDLEKTVDDMTVEEWDSCLDATLRSVFLLSKWAAREMKRAGGGSIINCGSVGATMAWATGAAYCASKGGMLQLTKVMAIEYGPWNIRVNTLSPGAIRTPNLDRVTARPGVEEKLINKSVLHRVGEPEEIAAAAAFLASDDASFVTASNLVVDGGYLTV